MKSIFDEFIKIIKEIEVDSSQYVKSIQQINLIKFEVSRFKKQKRLS